MEVGIRWDRAAKGGAEETNPERLACEELTGARFI
jgi:hypothetical protein